MVSICAIIERLRLLRVRIKDLYLSNRSALWYWLIQKINRGLKLLYFQSFGQTSNILEGWSWGLTSIILWNNYRLGNDGFYRPINRSIYNSCSFCLYLNRWLSFCMNWLPLRWKISALRLHWLIFWRSSKKVWIQMLFWNTFSMQLVQAIILTTLTFRFAPWNKSSSCVFFLSILGAYGLISSSIFVTCP